MLTPFFLFLTSLVLLATAAWLSLCWHYADRRRVAKDIPSMHAPWPILGHLHYCIRDLTGITKVVIEMSTRAVERGFYTTTVWAGPIPFLVFHDPNDVKALLRSCKTQNKFTEINLLRFALGDGLVTASGDLWRMKRRHLNPLFHPHNLQLLTPMFNANSRQLVERLSKVVDHGPLNILEYATDSALQTICGVIFGSKTIIDITSEEFQGIKRVVKSNNSLYVKRMFMVWLRNDSVFKYFYGKELTEIDKLVEAFTSDRLKEAMYEDTQTPLNMDHKDVETDYLTLLDAYRALQDNNPHITTRDLVDEIVTLYFTGSESVAVTTSSCLLALAQYPDIQEKLCNEIETVVGLNKDVEIDDLRKMPYLDQVMKETLRRFTIVPYVGRKTSEDMKLSSCTVPAGTTVFISILGSLLDPKTYPKPLKFDPERFGAKGTHGRATFTFLPFSSGSRKCIGEQYSMLIIKTLIVHLVRRFRFTTEMDINHLKRKLIISLVSVEGYMVSLQERL